MQLNFTPLEIPSALWHGESRGWGCAGAGFPTLEMQKALGTFTVPVLMQSRTQKSPRGCRTSSSTAALAPGLSWSYSKACLVKLLRVIDY